MDGECLFWWKRLKDSFCYSQQIRIYCEDESEGCLLIFLPQSVELLNVFNNNFVTAIIRGHAAFYLRA